MEKWGTHANNANDRIHASLTIPDYFTGCPTDTTANPTSACPNNSPIAAPIYNPTGEYRANKVYSDVSHTSNNISCHSSCLISSTYYAKDWKSRDLIVGGDNTTPREFKVRLYVLATASVP